jgi:hypothetical protein
MSTYGDGGTTYGGLFGGGVALYGGFGSSSVPDGSTSRRYRIYELSAATLREWSSGQLHEIAGVVVNEHSKTRVYEQSEGTIFE